MKTEYSGNIYAIELEHSLGLVYAELLDYSDIRPFDGILIQVYNYKYVDKPTKTNEIEEIKNSGILFGPVPINKYPNTKGKNSWKLIGKSINFPEKEVYFKKYRGLLFKENNWNNLKPWYKLNYLEENDVSNSIEHNYNEVHNLETLILNHPEMVKIKVSMLYLIYKCENVSDFYDLSDLGNKNMFIQLINTYFDNDKVELLLGNLSN